MRWILTMCLVVLVGASSPPVRFNPFHTAPARESYDQYEKDMLALEREYIERRRGIHAKYLHTLSVVRAHAVEDGDLDEVARIAEEEAFIAELMRLESSTPSRRRMPAHAAPIRVYGDGHTLAAFGNRKRAWANRNYTWSNVPESLEGWRFTQKDGGEPAAITVEAIGFGRLYVATRDDVELPLPWTRSSTHTFAYTDQHRTTMCIWWMVTSPGMRITIPQHTWTGAIVLAPPEAIVR